MSDSQIDIQIEIPKSHDFWNTISVIQINLDVSKETRVLTSNLKSCKLEISIVDAWEKDRFTTKKEGYSRICKTQL